MCVSSLVVFINRLHLSEVVLVCYSCRKNNLSLSLVLLVGCYVAILIPAYSHSDKLAPIDDDHQLPKDLVRITLSDIMHF